MSPFGTISTIHRAEVRIPDDVYDAVGHTQAYRTVSESASRIVEVSGQNAYSSTFEWGEAPTRRQCEDFIGHWHNWILQWQEQLRSKS